MYGIKKLNNLFNSIKTLIMQLTIFLVTVLCFFSPSLSQAPKNNHSSLRNIPISPSAKKERSHMQVVFALDATGSMTGLIGAAKDKIWSIASSLSQTEPAPILELGLIFYRDRGDDFITHIVPLTDSIDIVYTELMKITADGGGDGPESVNQGLYEAVTKFNWSPQQKVYKTIFLIGDYPPHMDYTDDVKYPESCILAKSKGIVLNTILMGNNKETEKVWNDISRCNQGVFVKANMNMNDIAISTPYDVEIANLSDSLESLIYYYGNATAKAMGEKMKGDYSSIRGSASVNVVAQRAEFIQNKKASYEADKTYITNDLLTDIMANRIKLDTIKIAALPNELKNLSPEERKTQVESKINLKKSLTKKLMEKTKLRSSYIDNELKKHNESMVESSFNNVIFKNIKQQAKRSGIELIGVAKY